MALAQISAALVADVESQAAVVEPDYSGPGGRCPSKRSHATALMLVTGGFIIMYVGIPVFRPGGVGD